MEAVKLVEKKIKVCLVLMYKSYYGKLLLLMLEKMDLLLRPVMNILHAFMKDKCGSVEVLIVE